MPPPLVTFCIATYNRGPVLLDCLHKILANGLPQNQFEILIVDNASTDNTPDLIAQHFPQITLIRLPKNCGPVAKNIAIRKAHGEFIVLLDDDAYPHPGSVPQMIRHFRDDKNLAAAVFDVILPDGSKESSAYPDVFIGAGTGLRRSVLQELCSADPSHGPLPADFFMQAEEYDLSFRILNAGGGGYSIQRFWDLPLTHLKSPGARIGQRTTLLDVRNNLYLLAKYIPEPLCHQLAADWLARYFIMATNRDTQQPPHPAFGTHKQAFLKGAAQGLANWSAKRNHNRHLLSPETLERIFKFQKIKSRMATAVQRMGGAGAKKILFADLGKNMLPYFLAAQQLNLQPLAILDDHLASQIKRGHDSFNAGCHGSDHNLGGQTRASCASDEAIASAPRDYRNIPILPTTHAPWQAADLVIISNLSPVHAPRRAAQLKRLHPHLPILDLFSRQEPLLHQPAALQF